MDNPGPEVSVNHACAVQCVPRLCVEHASVTMAVSTAVMSSVACLCTTSSRIHTRGT